MSTRSSGVFCRTLVAVTLLSCAGFAQQAEELEVVRERGDVPSTLTVEQARVVVDRSLAYLIEKQHENGSWGTGALDSTLEMGFSVETFYAWNLSAHGVAVLALLAAEETPERRATLERAIDWLCSARLPKRGSNWDIDFIWTALYGFVACTEAASDPRLQAPEFQEPLRKRGLEFLAQLEANQVPTGGWAYYDNPPYSRRPKWATSFCTALVVPALVRSQELGWGTEQALIDRSVAYVRRCGLPNGAFEYDLRPIPRVSGGEHINNVKGSLGRIQVCNWSLAAAGVPQMTHERIREGLTAFIEHHKFLDVARMRPIPHEGYYANAGYFYFFGHYYAAQAINQLPVEEREAWHAKLRPHVAKTQRADGSTSDFMASSYMITASTSFAALTLSLGLEAAPASSSATPGEGQ